MRPDAHTLLAPYATDALGADEARDVEAHLAECPTCRDDLAAMREVLADVAQTTAEAPPDRLRAAVLAGARRTPQERPRSGVAGTGAAPRPAGDRRASRGPVLLALAASAVLLVVVGGVVGALRLLGGPPADEVAALLAAEGTEVVRVAPDVPPAVGPVTAAGEVVALVNPGQGRAVVVARGLPRAPEGRTWQAWTLAGGQATSAGLFEVGGNGVGVVDFPWPDGGEAVAVSLEPEGGSDQPTTEPVVVAPVS